MDVRTILAHKGDRVETIRPDAPLLHAARLLRAHGVGALVVTADGQHIDGLLSERDVVVAFAEHPELRLSNFKQECGEVTSADGSALDYARYPIGGMLRILPYHSCAATHQHALVHVLEDDRASSVSETWRICKGW